MGEQGETVKAAPRGRKHRPGLATLAGLRSEAIRVYRLTRKGRIKHEEGRSLMWQLAELHKMHAAEELQQLMAKLDELQQLAERRHGNGNGREPQRLIEAKALPS